MSATARWIRVALLCTIAATGVYIGVTVVATRTVSTNPTCAGCNVILISIDSLGANQTSLDNSALDTTAFLKSLAERGTVFENAYAQAPWTLPSHAAMLTGKYPWSLNVWVPNDVLPASALTLAEQLQSAGYRTAAFSNGVYVQPSWGFGRGFDTFTGSLEQSAWHDSPQIFTDAAQWARTQSHDKPFFLFIHTAALYDPYAPDAQGVPAVKTIARLNLSQQGVPATTTAALLAEYRSALTQTDAGLKDFFVALQQAGTLKNTIVIITSDHGVEFGEHGTTAFHAVTTYREVLRVPLIVVSPRLTKARRITSTVEVRSIPATILELVALPKNYTMAPSLAPALSGIDLGDAVVRSATALTRTELLQVLLKGYDGIKLHPAVNAGAVQVRITSALQGRVHAIKQANGELELYDMQTDSGEMNNAYDPTLIQNATPTVKNVLNALSVPYD